MSEHMDDGGNDTGGSSYPRERAEFLGIINKASAKVSDQTSKLWQRQAESLNRFSAALEGFAASTTGHSRAAAAPKAIASTKSIDSNVTVNLAPLEKLGEQSIKQLTDIASGISKQGDLLNRIAQTISKTSVASSGINLPANLITTLKNTNNRITAAPVVNPVNPVAKPSDYGIIGSLITNLNTKLSGISAAKSSPAAALATKLNTDSSVASGADFIKSTGTDKTNENLQKLLNKPVATSEGSGGGILDSIGKSAIGKVAIKAAPYVAPLLTNPITAAAVGTVAGGIAAYQGGKSHAEAADLGFEPDTISEILPNGGASRYIKKATATTPEEKLDYFEMQDRLKQSQPQIDQAEAAKAQTRANRASGINSTGTTPIDLTTKAQMRNVQRNAQASGINKDDAAITSPDIGSISAKYESGKGGVDTISSGKNDAGGVSYGEHQLASKTGTMQSFINSPENAQFADKFKGLTPGSPEFNAAYKQTVADSGEGFNKAQGDFIQRTHYAPVKAMADKAGIDTTNPAIQKALYSESVQHSGAGNQSIIDSVAKSGVDMTDSDAVIKQIYKSRGEYASKYAGPSATTDRYAKEQKDVLAANQAAKIAPTVAMQDNKIPPSVDTPIAPTVATQDNKIMPSITHNPADMSADDFGPTTPTPAEAAAAKTPGWDKMDFGTKSNYMQAATLHREITSSAAEADKYRGMPDDQLPTGVSVDRQTGAVNIRRNDMEAAERTKALVNQPTIANQDNKALNNTNPLNLPLGPDLKIDPNDGSMNYNAKKFSMDSDEAKKMTATTIDPNLTTPFKQTVNAATETPAPISANADDATATSRANAIPPVNLTPDSEIAAPPPPAAKPIISKLPNQPASGGASSGNTDVSLDSIPMFIGENGIIYINGGAMT